MMLCVGYKWHTGQQYLKRNLDRNVCIISHSEFPCTSYLLFDLHMPIFWVDLFFLFLAIHYVSKISSSVLRQGWFRILTLLLIFLWPGLYFTQFILEATGRRKELEVERAILRSLQNPRWEIKSTVLEFRHGE